jgi:hypothetical protein
MPGREKDLVGVHTLSAPWLKAVQAAWLLGALLAFTVLLASLPAYLELAKGSLAIREVEIGVTSASDTILNVLSALASLASAVLSLGLSITFFWKRMRETAVAALALFFLAYSVFMAGPLELSAIYWGIGDLTQAGTVQGFFFTVPLIGITLLFPSGHFVPSWSRWPFLFSILAGLALFFWPTFDVTDLSTLDPVHWVFLALLGVLLLVGLAGQVYRYRRISGPAERQQTKWALFGLVLWISYMVISSIPYYYINSLPEGAPDPWWARASFLGWFLSLNIFPLFLAIAITRHRLWDIDLVINRALVYTALTALLALVYFGSVASLQSLFTAASGQRSPVSVVASTLLIAALFTPLRRLVQGFIDRRFYRSHYDAAQTLARFAAAVRQEVDLDELKEELARVVQDTFQPAAVSVWLKK